MLPIAALEGRRPLQRVGTMGRSPGCATPDAISACVFCAPSSEMRISSAMRT